MEIVTSLAAMTSAASVPAGTSGVGWTLAACSIAVVIVSLAAIILWQHRAYRRLEDRVVELTAHALKLEKQIASELAPEFSLRDVLRIWVQPTVGDDGERVLLIKFATVAGMVDFHWWAKNQAKRATAQK